LLKDRLVKHTADGKPCRGSGLLISKYTGQPREPIPDDPDEKVVTPKVTVTKEALRDMVREALDNKEFSGWSSNEEGHANVNANVDPSIAVTDPVNPNFTPQDKTELGIAIGQLVKNLPDTDMPGIYTMVKKSIDQKTEKEQEADMEKRAMQGGTKQVEEALRAEVRREIMAVLKETFVDPADAQADEDEEEPTDADGVPKKRPHSYKATALGGGMAASFEEIAKTLGFSVAGAKQAVDKAIEKLKFLYGLPEDDREILVLTAMNDYISKLNGTGELTAADVQLMHDHPDIVRELDGFREFLHNSIRKARKPGQKVADPLGESDQLDEDDEANSPKPGDRISMTSLKHPQATASSKPGKDTQKAKSLTYGNDVSVDWNGLDEEDDFADLEV
jgi:hypothetical protein